jgi:hypothetical protein
LLAPGLAEEAQRRDRGQAQEHVAAIELLPEALAGSAVLIVLVVFGHG